MKERRGKRELESERERELYHACGTVEIRGKKN